MKTDLLLCAYHSAEHQIIVHHDDEDNEVYMHIHLQPLPFFKRLVAGVRYIFGYTSYYGAWDEFIFNSADAEKVQAIADTLRGEVPVGVVSEKAVCEEFSTPDMPDGLLQTQPTKQEEEFILGYLFDYKPKLATQSSTLFSVLRYVKFKLNQLSQ